MLDIREELKLAVYRRNTSMRKVAAALMEKGCDVPKESGLSNQIRRKRVRFQTVQEILDYLGFELVIREKH